MGIAPIPVEPFDRSLDRPIIAPWPCTWGYRAIVAAAAMSEPARLRTLALLDGLSDDQIGQLAAAGEWVLFDAGDELFGQAAPARSWFLLLDGRIALFRRTGHDEQRVGTMDTPGQWAGGFRAWDEHGVYLATGRAIESGHLLRVPAERLRSLADSWFPLGVHFIRGLVQTVRNIESIARQRESLAALGTLAAGLAHELNNPLATILSYAERLSQKATLDDSVRRGLETILSESERAARIVRNLLTFARKRQTTRAMVDVNQVVR